MDIAEENTVIQFTTTTCKCSTFNGGPCSKAFSLEHIQAVRDQCAALNRYSLDLMLMGQIMANTTCSASTAGYLSPLENLRRAKFYHHGIRVSTS